MESASLLPKGIVVNSPGIEGCIERFNTEPLDVADIARFWKVYTTTKRRLLDPTAERLENYWWRIWGSRSRELKGATVARLFAHISDGQSFVPLRGPANRDEGNTPLNRTARHGSGASSTTAIHRPNQSRPSTTTSPSAAARPSVSSLPPILKTSESNKKKNRGSSATGPRPTARFISPHDSENEGSPISPNSHVVVQPPSPITQESTADRKTNALGGKKGGGFIASARRKRPVLVRRQSSQSSTESPSKSIDGQGLPSSTEETPPTFVEQAQERSKQLPRTKSQANSSPTSEKSTTTKKSHSSRRSRTPDTKHLSPRKHASGNRESSRESPHVTEETATSGDLESSTNNLCSIENSQEPEMDLTAEELEELEVQELLLAEASSRVPKQARISFQGALPLAQNEGFQILHSALRSRSDGSQDLGGAVRHVPNENKSAASLAPTLTDATGQSDMGDKSQASRSSKKVDKGKGRDLEETRKAGMFAKRPVQPVASASDPDSTGLLSRSKSQLTLLLERDRAKSVDNSSTDDEGKKR